MFGYIKCYPAELRLREYEYYRGVYCGLCRSMGRCTGCLSRLTLSYDFVFLALTRMALTGEKPKIKTRRCAVHPFRKRPICQSCVSTDFAAGASAVIAWHKLVDDIDDTRGPKKLFYLLLRPVLSHARRYAGELGELDGRIADIMRRFRVLEGQENVSADILADLSGEMLADVFGFGLDERSARIAREIGYHVGRWVYLIDAVDDYYIDIKNKEFTPFAKSGLPSNEAICSALTSEMAATETAVGLFPEECGSEIGELIRNILYLGTERVTAGVIERHNAYLNRKVKPKKHKKCKQLEADPAEKPDAVIRQKGNNIDD